MNMRDFWRVVGDVIDRSDLLLEVVDARMPYMTRNKKVENMMRRRGKPYILVFNKSDLVSEKMIDECLKRSRSERIVFVSSKRREGFDKLKELILRVAKGRGRTLNINVGVVGYPNTGKSSIINILTGRGSARVSPVPGETRGIQWVMDKEGIRYSDTPGVVPYDGMGEDERAMMSVLDPDKLEQPHHAALKIIDLFLKGDKAGLEKHYGIEVASPDPEEVFAEIGKAKHFLAKKGEIDRRRTALLIIRDWQRGRILLN
jgi:ribosome biogenesis GTPase A